MPLKQLKMLALCTVIGILVSACGTFTGIPSHGGGKRFAIEQELVAATVRAAAKDLDVSALSGRKISVSIVGLEDHGGGNLVGGRYSLSALLSGQYISTPRNEFPVVTTTTNTGGVVTVAENALNSPERTRGAGVNGNVGVGYNGQGAFGNTVIGQNLQDAVFLARTLAQVFALRGIELVGEGDADTDVSILVDVFGTVRSRHDWHLVNQESLIAKTALEITAIDRATGEVVLSPQSTSFEAEYNEQYVLWAGPVQTKRQLRRGDPLLVDFSGLQKVSTVTRTVGIKVPVQSSEKKE